MKAMCHLEVEVDGVDVLPAAGDAGLGCSGRKGAIRTELSREFLEFLDGVAEVKQAVEQGQGEGTIRTAPAETRLGGKGLDEVEVDRREGVLLGEQGMGTADEVVLGFPRDRAPCRCRVYPSPVPGWRPPTCRTREWEEEAIEGMESILAAMPDLKPKVDLGVGEGDPSGRAGINHRSSRIA